MPKPELSAFWFTAFLTFREYMLLNVFKGFLK